VFTTAALIGLPGAALAAAAPSAQDTTYLTSNMQTSLAEITIGNLALTKSDDKGVQELADMTVADHTAALAKASALAQTLGIPVPTEPSEEQKAQAAQLQAASGTAFDQLYAQIQVAGHTKSVASTNTEISSGTEQSVKQYATEYLPVATMHLEMAQQLVADTGAGPTSVPAGTGGMAADGMDPVAVSLVGVGIVAVIGGLFLFRNRGTRPTSGR
jgi:predicted outer membrane protein